MRLLRIDWLLFLWVILFVPAVRSDNKEPDAAAVAADAKALDQKILAEAKNHSEILANITYLCDVIGPRLTGSENLKRANEWAAERMRSYGLENVRLEPWEIPVGWERGPASARIVEPPINVNLLIASAGWTPGTKGKIVGPVVILKASKREDLAQYKGKLKDAIILRGEPRTIPPITTPIDPNLGPYGIPRQPMGNRPMGGGDGQPMPNPPASGDGQPTPNPPASGVGQPMPNRPMAGDQPPPRGNFGEMQRLNQEIRDFLKAEGVAAVLQDSSKPHGLLVTTGSWRGRERAEEQDGVTTLFIAHEHYRLLWRLASRPEPAVTKVELEVTNRFIPGPITVYNTVGEIRGSEKPDEFVVVGAHIDSWDLAQGATDNGTGTCVVLETARVLAKCGVKPKRTIKFVLFSGEEQGLHGSRQFVERHKDQMSKCSMALVHDTGTGKVISIGLQGREVLKPIFERELESLKEIGVTSISTRSIGGTDHQSFERVGVPGFACYQEPHEYRLTHHTQTDTVDKVIEANLIQGTQVMAVAAMRVANLPELLPRERRAGQQPQRPGTSGGGE
ncbi:MAG: M20/M25/M40 family metallo-hydrolase [Gemmataceae bacterium]|nr:M20/M25/M40 family metallo-hydrolase [Gemmataceae bacterium]